MFLNIDYAKQAAEREKKLTNSETLIITAIDDEDDFDYEQLFDDHDMTASTANVKVDTKKSVKRVRFAPIADENSLTPTLSRSSSLRPIFDVEFDFDSLVSPSNEPIQDKANDSSQWKNAFLNDLHVAKINKPITQTSPSKISNENKRSQDNLWDFMKQSKPELVEKIQRTNHKNSRTVSTSNFEAKIELQPNESSNIQIIEIQLENDKFNQVHEELLQFLVPYHRILCQMNIWPQEHNFTGPNVSLQLIKCISENKAQFNSSYNRSDVLKHLMFIYTITSFLYVFAYCSLQTAIRHVENIIIQNMKNICIDQERGKPLFDLLTKIHQNYENILHPKILRIKHMFMNFFEQRRQLINTINYVPEFKFLLLVQYESIDLLHDIEYGLSSIIELRSYVYDKQTNINDNEFDELLTYYNMILIRTRQISPTILKRPKQLTLVIEYEYSEQTQIWHKICQQQMIPYLAYKTILPSFTNPQEIEHFDVKEKQSSAIIKDDLSNVPTIVLARPLVDNFKLLRTLERRHDISIITRDYHLLSIPVDRQPDILINPITTIVIFDLTTKLDVNIIREKIQSMILHSCHIHVAILTSGSTPDFILSTYITPINQLVKEIQQDKSTIDIEILIKSFTNLDEFADYVARLVQQEQKIEFFLSPTPSWNEKMLLRRCSSLNSISAQFILHRLRNVDLSTVNIDRLMHQCPEIPATYLNRFLSDIHKNS